MAMDFCANFEGVSSHGQTGWNSFHRPPNHPPILNIMCHDGYAPLGAIVLSPWQAKVNFHHTFPIQLYGEGHGKSIELNMDYRGNMTRGKRSL